MDHDKDCPFPDDEFGEMVAALATLYLLGKDIPTDDEGRALVTVHAEHDDEADIFLLKIGIGADALTIMGAERDIARAAREAGAE